MIKLYKRVLQNLFPLLAAIIALSCMPQAAAAPFTRNTAELETDSNRIFGLQRSRVVRMALEHTPGRSLDVVLPFEDTHIDVALTPYSVRSAQHQVLVQDEDGNLSAVASGPIRTMRGEVTGMPGSYVAGSLLDDGLHLRVLLPNNEELWVEPISRRVPGSSAGHHVVYRGADVLPTGGTCEARMLPAAALGGGGGEASSAPDTGGAAVVKVAELAVDADYEYFLDYGSSVATVQARIESVINAVNVQYERDVGITHALGTILVRSSASDPYTSSNAETLLNEFRNHWNANHGNIQRDVAHLFTGKSIDGGTIGIAWIGVICNGSYGYGLSESDFNNNFSCATDLTAHELGHNWNAGHCDCTSHTMNPYITCANVFHPTLTIPTITSFRDSRSCLTDEVNQPPAAPASLSASAVSDAQINLAWTAGDANALGFDIERSSDGSTWSALASVGASSASYQDTGLTGNQTYYYRVFAYNDVGSSGASDTASATTFAPPAPPNAPGTLSATAVSESQIDLVWVDLSDNEDGFKIERSADGGANWVEIGQSGPNDTAYTDAGLAASSTYHYQVRAFNSAGNSGYSNVDSATTLDPPAFIDYVANGEFFVAGTVSGNYTDTWTDDDGSILEVTERQSGGRPSRRYSFCEHVLEFNVQPGLAVTAFVQAWGGSSEDSFVFAYSTDGGSTYAEMFEAPLTESTSAQAYSLPATTAGSVLIRVTDTDQGIGNTSLDTVFIDHAYIHTDLAPGNLPNAPSNLSAVADSASQVTVAWTDNAADEFGYELERSPDGVSWEVIASLGAGSSGYIDTDVQPNSAYSYRTRAYNGSGYSAYSNTGSATTPDGPAGINLTSAVGYKIKGKHHVDLTWSGGGATVDIMRTGGPVAGEVINVSNTGTYTDNIGAKGGGTYTYVICEVGGGACSNQQQVSF